MTADNGASYFLCTYTCIHWNIGLVLELKMEEQSLTCGCKLAFLPSCSLTTKYRIALVTYQNEVKKLTELFVSAP